MNPYRSSTLRSSARSAWWCSAGKHAAVEEDLADRGRAEEVDDRLEGGGCEVGHVDEIRARVGGRGAEDDDGQRATGRAEVVSLAVEDEHWGSPERSSCAPAFIAGIVVLVCAGWDKYIDGRLLGSSLAVGRALGKNICP